MAEKRTIQFEVAVRARLTVETQSLILKPQSAVFLGSLFFRIRIRIRIRVSGNTCDILCMVKVKVRVTNGCDL